MNVVVGNSIKIETSLNISAEAFKKRFFNSTQWTSFLFSSQSEQNLHNDMALNAFEYLGNNRLILEDKDVLVDTIIVKTTAQKTHLQIVVDFYDDEIDVNQVINNIIENTDVINDLG